MEAIRDTVTSLLATWRTRHRGADDDLGGLLKAVCTKKELQHIGPGRLKNGALYLRVDSSSWLYHFSLRKEDLLAKMAKKRRDIQKIYFRIGEIQ